MSCGVNTRPWYFPTILILSLAAFGPGCSLGDGISENSSPIVQPDSEAGKKALAESERLFRERQEQEAKARKRFHGLPEEG
jgi:hypothetical protein